MHSATSSNHDHIMYSNGTWAYRKIDGSEGTKNVLSSYTARPTNTSILYCIKY